MVVWSPLVVIPGLCLLAGAALGWLIYQAAPRRPTNRRLALMLVIEGITYGMGAGILYTMDDAHAAFGIQGIFITAAIAVPWLHLRFLATLDTPIVRFLRYRLVDLLLIGAPLAIEAYWFTHTATFMPEVFLNPGYALYEVGLGPGMELVFEFMGLVSLFSLIVATSAFRRARTPTSRQRTKWYLFAFATRDCVIIPLFFLWPLVLPLPPSGSFALDLIFLQAAPTAMLLFISMLAYGILKNHVLDIDLKVKFALRHSTVLLIFASVFLIVQQSVQAVTTSQFGLLAGAVAAGILLVAILPLERLARRVADRAMPSVSETPEYLDRRRIEVYRAALEEVVDPTGTVAPAGLAVLERLRHELGISERDHQILLVSGVSASRDPRALAPGNLFLGRYRIQRLLGVGSAGQAFLAHDETMRRDIVIKEVAGATAGGLEECRALARIRHPNVLTIHDIEVVGNRTYLFLEHMEGGSLRDRLKGGPLSTAQLRCVADGLLAGLDAVHGTGLVHRDVKPANVLLDRAGNAKLADFSLVRLSDAGETAATNSSAGTAAYMSPEQARGESTGPQTDLFAAGATLYEAASGRPLRSTRPGEGAGEMWRRVAAGREAAAARLPTPTAWFKRALAADPSQRFASAQAMRQALQAAPGAP